LALAARRSLERLCRGRSVAFRLGDGQVVRLAGAPAVLGRDPETEIPLRDPSVSRRHARILAAGGGLAVEDAGSRGGTVLAGFPLAGAVPLKDRGELALGASCRLGFEVKQAVVLLRADGGLDRGLFAVVGHGPIKLDDIPGLPPGLVLDFGAGLARLVRTPELHVRVAGQIIGRGCDLLHGDVIEAPGGVRWEVL
jgi:hypothetical protein